MRYLVLLACLVSLAGCQTTGAASQWVETGTNIASAAGFGEQAQAVEAVCDTLSTSSSLATSAMGKQGSYNIPLPQQLATLQSTLTKLGYGDTINKLHTQMNQAASAAASEAAPVFKDAIKEATLTDALGLLNGGQTAVTDYFRSHTHDKLAAKMAPIVEQKLEATGFNGQYKQLLNIYNALPLASKPDLDIKKYVVNQSLDGIYNKMGEEETSIRNDPKKAASKLVQQFLGGDKG